MNATLEMKCLVKRVVGSVAPWLGVVGVNYHRIGDGRSSPFDRGLWSATPEALDAQLRWLKSHFDVISPREIAYVVRVRRGRHVVVTFDDGYLDNFTTAYPILRSNRVPATFFVSTGFLDNPRLPWWDEIAWMVRTSARPGIELRSHLSSPIIFDKPDRQKAIRALLRIYYRLSSGQCAAFMDALAQATGTGRYVDVREHHWMTWDMVREMRAGGMTIGGHTVNHPVLARLSRDEQRSEIVGCRRRLEEELGVPMRSFAYPVGQLDSFNVETRECLREAGVQTAFSYYGGFRPIESWDDYDVRRIPIEQSDTFDEFRAKVTAPGLT